MAPWPKLTPARAMIRTSGPSALYTLMEQSIDAGCQTMERALVELVRAGKISEETAREAAVRRDGFDRLIRATGAGR